MDGIKNDVIFEEQLQHQPSKPKTASRRSRPQTAKPLNSRSGRNRKGQMDKTATNGTSKLNMLEDSGEDEKNKVVVEEADI